MSNGTIGSTHGYGPMGGGLGGMGGPGGSNQLPNYSGAIGNMGMNINVYKGQSNSNNQNIKESISFSKINANFKQKKRQ